MARLQVEFHSANELNNWLAMAGINTEGWGKGGTKSVGDLWREYIAGESSFEDDPPERLAEVVQLRIRRGAAVLIELAQEFFDGRTRFRQRPPSEKMKRGETAQEAALRCLDEELGLGAADVRLDTGARVIETYQDSPSYPGLRTHYVIHIISGETDILPDGDFYRNNVAAGDPIHRHWWGWRAAEGE